MGSHEKAALQEIKTGMALGDGSKMPPLVKSVHILIRRA
jgi:hypothetical protein